MIALQIYATYWLLSILAGFIVAFIDPPWSSTFLSIAFGGPILSAMALFVIGALATIWSQ